LGRDGGQEEVVDRREISSNGRAQEGQARGRKAGWLVAMPARLSAHREAAAKASRVELWADYERSARRDVRILLAESFSSGFAFQFRVERFLVRCCLREWGKNLEPLFFVCQTLERAATVFERTRRRSQRSARSFSGCFFKLSVRAATDLYRCH
jgi:hypothetical protein